jgi:hypothetical protein
MSSGSSGRYQSKLFNFVHQQTRQLTQQWENTFRNLQVAAKSSLEALLYPLYLLFQPDESAGNRLQGKASQPELLPTADAPIQQILEIVQHLSTEAPTTATTSQSVNPWVFFESLWLKFVHNQPQNLAISENQHSLKQHLPAVQGIATDLVNRHLVLVTDDNEILDILTTQQQAKLSDQIISEIADYGYAVRLASGKTQKEILPEIDRLLNKLTGTKPENTPILSGSAGAKVFFPSHKILAWLDVNFAKLEVTTLVPVQQRSQEIIQVAQTQLEIFIYGKEQLEARKELTTVDDKIESQSLNIQALIEAALNYFFGDKSSKKFEDKSQVKVLPKISRELLAKNQQLLQVDLTVDPWLTLDDLFGNAESKTLPSPAVNSFIATNSTVVDSPTKETSESGLSTSKSASNWQISVNTKKQLEKYKSKVYQLEAEPDWIETTATSLGYESHPLEQILQWLDKIMLWIEQIILNFIYFMKGLLAIK